MASLQAMRELIPIREEVLEMQKLVFGGQKVLECRSHSKNFEFASNTHNNDTINYRSRQYTRTTTLVFSLQRHLKCSRERSTLAVKVALLQLE
jgi:hypothetical protein